MEQGQVVATGSPGKVFSQFTSGFVARLLGEVNIFEVAHTAAEQGLWTWKEEHTGMELKSLPFSSNGYGKILVRTRDVLLAEHPFSSSVQNLLKGTVEACFPASEGMQVSVDAGLKFHLLLSEKAVESLQIKPGKVVFVGFKASAVQPIG
jgi:ABC-type molybdate transport system ATPase subunit